MQTSYTPNDWNEDGTESRLRDALNKDSSPDLVRKLYPFQAKLLKHDGTYGFQAGYIFKYARTKHKLSLYPIEICTALEPRELKGLVTGIHHYSSDEAELMRVEG